MFFAIASVFNQKLASASAPNLAGKPFISGFDFGAKGDGQSDDTMALQQAIDYCGDHHRALHLSGGRYSISRPLTIGFYPGLQILGEGWLNTEIISKADGQPIIRTSSKDTHSVVISSLKLSYERPQSSAGELNAYGIEFSDREQNGSGFYHWIVSQVWIENAAVAIGEEQWGGKGFPVWGCRFQDLLITHFYRTAILLKQPGGVHAGQPLNSFDNIKVLNNGAINSGPVLDLIGEWRITNLDVEDCYGTILASDSSFANYLSSVHIERHRLGTGDTRVFALYDGDYHIESVAFHAINQIGHPFCLVHTGSGNTTVELHGLSLGGANPRSYEDVKFICGAPRKVQVTNLRVTAQEDALPAKFAAAIHDAESRK